MSFMHHRFLSIECVYRVWERITQVFYYIHTGKEKKQGYYGNVIDMMSKSKIYQKDIIQNLKQHQKQWDSIAKFRNYYSHEYTKLIDGINYDVSISPIIDLHGRPIFKSKETFENLKNIFNIIYKQNFLYFKKLDESLIKIINWQ